MSRLRAVLASANKPAPRSGEGGALSAVLERAVIGHFEEIVPGLVNGSASSTLEVLRAEIAQIMQGHMRALTQELAHVIAREIESRPVPAPVHIHETPQVTQIIERVVEEPEEDDEPPKPMIVVRDKAGRIAQVKQGALIYAVRRDADGLITKVVPSE